MTPDFTASTAPTIAVVGSGAIARSFHVPALARHPQIRERMILVDPELDRARELGREVGVSRVATALDDVLPELDGAVLAVPAVLHAPLTLRCVRAGVHVLCEKPLAQTGEEVRRIVDEAADAGVTVGVNNTRRLAAASKMVKEIVESGELGAPRHLEYLQGERFDWPAASGGYFGAENGRGILADLGAHVLDLACWWLPGSAVLEAYADDSRGGTEAVASVRFSVGDCSAYVALSWLSRYANTYRLDLEHGSIRGDLFDERTVVVERSGGGRPERRSASRVALAEEMLDAFVGAAMGTGAPAVSAADVLPSVELLDTCYRSRTPLPEPWYANAAPVEVR